MECDKCKKKSATVKPVKSIEGNRKFFMLCEVCANEDKEVVLESEMDDLNCFNLNKILSGLVDYVGHKEDRKNISYEVECKECGTKYEEFRKDLAYLNEELIEAINFEEYEKAAIIRDEIRTIKTNNGGE